MATLKPADAAEVALAIREAAESRRTLEIVGTGSRRNHGRPVHADATLELSALSAIVAYEHDELVLTAQAGAPLSLITSLLREHQQHLAFEPPDLGPLWGLPEGRGTIGGALATGLGGSRRPSAGAPRDHFLGFKGVNGTGQEFSAGGKVVKNVTGYDLPKLLAGSFGTLAVMTEVTVKVLPAPRQSRTLALFGMSEEVALARLREIAGGSVPISAAAYLPAAMAGRFSGVFTSRDEGVAAIRVEGVDAAVCAGASGITRRLGSHCDVVTVDAEACSPLWRAIGGAAAFAGSSTAVWRLSIPPLSAAAVGRALRQLGASSFYFDWGGGAVWVEAPSTDDGGAQAIRAIANKAGGHATLMRGDPELRERIDPFDPPEPALAALQRRVKERFDPLCLFNPGRMYRGI